MAVILVSIASTIIVFLTVFYLIRLFILAYKKEAINFWKFMVLVISSIVVGLLLAVTLHLGYQKLWFFLSN